jgi:hypothetical protein
MEKDFEKIEIKRNQKLSGLSMGLKGLALGANSTDGSLGKDAGIKSKAGITSSNDTKKPESKLLKNDQQYLVEHKREMFFIGDSDKVSISPTSTNDIQHINNDFDVRNRADVGIDMGSQPSTLSSIETSNNHALKYIHSQPVMYGTRIQRQQSLVDWSTSRVGIKKKSFREFPLPRSENSGHAIRSPAMSFLQSLASQVPKEQKNDYAIGDEIGDYTLVQDLAHSNLSTVYVATTTVRPHFDAEKTNGQYQVCVKIANLKQNSKIEHECQLWSRLCHPFVLQMHECIQIDGEFIVVSELALDGDLLHYVKYKGRPGLLESTTRMMFSQLCHALGYLHSLHIIHHDIKLENILLQGNRIKLCDFGLSEALDDKHPQNCYGICCRTSARNVVFENNGEVKGSLHYLSPEQLQGKHYRAPYCDIWALGCVLYCMATGALPFNDNFLPRLQLYIMSGKYDVEPLNGPVRELVPRLLCVEVEDRIDIKSLIEDDFCLPMEELL